MQFTFLNRKSLPEIPSASGIEVVGDSMYVMSDDSPWLFKLNKKLEIIEKLQVADILSAVGGKIPKGQKQDLEAMASFEGDLLLFGSGSKSPQRDVLIMIKTETHETKKHSLTQFYDSLCQSADFKRDDLNIEAAAIVEHTLYLFNRGKNRIFRFNVQQFFAHVENDAPLPLAEICRVTLPALNGLEAGFSGATTAPNSKYIVFTASVENTPNWIDDGEILGSFVGLFPLGEFKESFVPDCIAVTDSERHVLKIKVESVAVQEISSPGIIHLLMVTDTDGDSSELIEAELKY